MKRYEQLKCVNGITENSGKIMASDKMEPTNNVGSMRRRQYSLLMIGAALQIVTLQVFAQAAQVKGYIDPVSSTSTSINGWACATTLSTSIQVHLYVGGPAGTGTGVGPYSANKPSEPAIATSCGASGANYRFSIPITDALKRQHGGKSIYIHGISPVGGSNLLIDNSGKYTVPIIPPEVTSSQIIEYDELGRVIAWKREQGSDYSSHVRR